MPHEQASLMLLLSEELKDALLAYAGKVNVSMAQVVREAIATRIEFDLAASERRHKASRVDGRGRPRIYASPEVQRAEAHKRERAKRALATALMLEHEREDAALQRQALQDSIERKEARARAGAGVHQEQVQE